MSVYFGLLPYDLKSGNVLPSPLPPTHPPPSPNLVQIHLLVVLITLPQDEIRIIPDK